jgi:hypothetical protein
MKYRRRSLVAVLVPLLLASPAGARGSSNIGSEQLTRSGLSYAPVSRLERPGSAGALFPDHATGVSISQIPIVQEDGSETVRRTIVGSMPIAENLNVGLGLFSVNGARVTERSFARSRPMEDVFARGKTVAAVGLSLRF